MYFFTDSQAGAGVDTGFGQQTTGSFGFSGTTQPGLSTGTGALSSSGVRGESFQDPPPPIVLPNGQISIHSASSSRSFISNALPTDHTNAVVIPTRSSPVVTSRTRIPDIQTVVTTILPPVTRSGRRVTQPIINVPEVTRVPSGSGNTVFRSDVSVSIDGLSGSAVNEILKSMKSSVPPVRPTKPVPTVGAKINKQHSPDIRIIEIPILPEGQTAAFLNITRDVRPSLVETKAATGKSIPLRKTTLSRDGNMLRLSIGESASSAA